MNATVWVISNPAASRRLGLESGTRHMLEWHARTTIGTLDKWPSHRLRTLDPGPLRNRTDQVPAYPVTCPGSSHLPTTCCVSPGSVFTGSSKCYGAMGTCHDCMGGATTPTLVERQVTRVHKQLPESRCGLREALYGYLGLSSLPRRRVSPSLQTVLICVESCTTRGVGALCLLGP